MELSKALGAVHMLMADTADKATARRLMVLRDNCSCAPGCSACCSRLVYISVAEGLVMFETLSNAKVWDAVKTRSQALLRYTRVAKPLAWFKMNLQCPVLDPESKCCLSYITRPATCSTHFVTSPAVGCDPWSTEWVVYHPADMDDLFTDFQNRLAQTIDEYGIANLRFPLPFALLFAERIQKQPGVDYNKLVSLVYNEFSA